MRRVADSTNLSYALLVYERMRCSRGRWGGERKHTTAPPFILPNILAGRVRPAAPLYQQALLFCEDCPNIPQARTKFFLSLKRRVFFGPRNLWLAGTNAQTLFPKITIFS